MEYNPSVPDELTYIWEAFYDDGTSLKQFDKEEHHFGHIDQSKLKFFSIYHKNNPHDRYTVCLDDGLISYKNDVVHGTLVKNKKIKLIYFRRVQRILNSDKPAKITNFMGWHGTVSGEYKKYMIAVTANGEYIIADHL